MNKRKKGILLMILISCMLFIRFGLAYDIMKGNKNIYCIGKSNIQFINNQNSVDNKYDINEFVQLIVFILLYIIIIKIDTIKAKFIVLNKNREAEKLRRSLELKCVFYSQENLKFKVKNIISKIYKAFLNMDITYVKDYVHTNTYQIYKSKIEWMKIRNESLFDPHSKLLECKLVGLEHYNDISEDKIYFFIKLKIKENMRRDWRNLDDSNKNTEKIFELWEFTIEDDKWVLHKIIKLTNFEDLMKMKAFSES